MNDNSKVYPFDLKLSVNNHRPDHHGICHFQIVNYTMMTVTRYSCFNYSSLTCCEEVVFS